MDTSAPSKKTQLKYIYNKEKESALAFFALVLVAIAFIVFMVLHLNSYGDDIKEGAKENPQITRNYLERNN